VPDIAVIYPVRPTFDPMMADLASNENDQKKRYGKSYSLAHRMISPLTVTKEQILDDALITLDEPPYSKRYVRWCEPSGGSHFLLIIDEIYLYNKEFFNETCLNICKLFSLQLEKV
jgi:hypothetical protein